MTEPDESDRIARRRRRSEALETELAALEAMLEPGADEPKEEPSEQASRAPATEAEDLPDNPEEGDQR